MNINEIKNIRPWNDKDDPIKVNTIRYNQDFSLLSLGTSKGYRVFLTSNLKLTHEITEANTNLGDILIAMTYYKSNLVFLLPKKNNEKYSNKELIVFDDFYQNILASFKDKNEGFINFGLSKNTLFIVALSKIIVIELFSFKVIEIIEKINSNNKLISFNYVDYLAYINLENKKEVCVNFYENLNYKLISKSHKKISIPFDYVQIINISPKGNYIGVVSIFGNKIHIYNTQTGKLKECIFTGPTVQTLEKMVFSEKKPNYILLVKNDFKLYVYKIGKTENSKCICDKYSDKNMIGGESVQEEKNGGFLGFIRKSFKNKDIKEVHSFTEYDGKLIFADFDRNKHKDLFIINHSGLFNNFHFNKKKSGKISSKLSLQWI
jgi:hypothetical protein